MTPSPEPVRARMRSKLESAVAIARRRLPGSKLVSIFGFVVDEFGTVLLGKPGAFINRWEYAFKGRDPQLNAREDVYLTVLYWMDPLQPTVSIPAGNVVCTEPFPDEIVWKLLDSDVIVAAFHRFTPLARLTGSENDFVMYKMEDGTPTAIVTNAERQSFNLHAIDGAPIEPRPRRRITQS